MRFGEFEVLGRLGTGGMGEVFRAKKRGAPCEVALKLIRAEHFADPHFQTLFRAEAEVGALVDHPNLVRVVEFGDVGGVPFLAQELVDGCSLDRLSTQGPLSPPVAVHVALEVLSALAYAHALTDAAGQPLKFVHRDVSAANVLVSRRGEVKLTDFGVVKLRGRSITRTGEVKGKRECMAPEQLLGGRVGAHIDLRVDIFAVGALLHGLLYGERPFDDVEHWMRSGARITCDPLFQPILSRALAVDPDRRYASAGELALAIGATLRPAENARALLSGLVHGATLPERPLTVVDSLILDEFADSAPHPTRRRGTAPGVGPRGFDELPTDPFSADPRDLLPGDGGDTAPLGSVAPPTRLLPHRASLPRVADPETQPLSPPAVQRAWVRALGTGTAVAVAVAVAIAVAGPSPPVQIVDPRPPIARVATVVVTPAPEVAAPVPEVAELVPEVAEPAPEVAEPAAEVAASASAAEVAVSTEVAVPTVEPLVRRPVKVVAAAPVRAARAPAAAAEGTGYLTLFAEPWAVASVGGKRLGVTPFVRVPLAAGRHTVQLDLEGSGRRRTVVVQIASGTERRLALHLE